MIVLREISRKQLLALRYAVSSFSRQISRGPRNNACILELMHKEEEMDRLGLSIVDVRVPYLAEEVTAMLELQYNCMMMICQNLKISPMDDSCVDKFHSIRTLINIINPHNFEE